MKLALTFEEPTFHIIIFSYIFQGKNIIFFIIDCASAVTFLYYLLKLLQLFRFF